MKTSFKNASILLLVALLSVNCGGQSNKSTQSLSQRLTAKGQFSVTQDNLASLVDDCGEIFSEAGTTTSNTSSVSMLKSQSSTSGGSASIHVSFKTSTFSVTSGNETLASGSWREMDSNTIEITLDGETVQLDVTLEGDAILFALPVGADLDCSYSGGTSATTSEGTSSEGTSATTSSTGTSATTSSTIEDEEETWEEDNEDWEDTSGLEAVQLDVTLE